MVKLKKHLDLLGLRVEDRVTGFKGVVATVGFDLYGCIQAIVNPGIGKDGKLQESQWFDVNRLRVTSNEQVMARPEFEWTPQVIAEAGKGPAERAVAAEREECAQVCDALYHGHIGAAFGEVRYGIAACAGGIRARGAQGEST